jgi:hypothetical protein
MIEMIDLQKLRVDDHIADLQHEAERIRVERELDRARRAASGRSGRQVDGTAAASQMRLRLGRWLVQVGEAVAGPKSPCDDDSSVPNAA